MILVKRAVGGWVIREVFTPRLQQSLERKVEILPGQQGISRGGVTDQIKDEIQRHTNRLADGGVPVNRGLVEPWRPHDDLVNFVQEIIKVSDPEFLVGVSPLENHQFTVIP